MLKGKIFAISGTLSEPRNYFVDWITGRGGVVSPSVTKKVTHLIVSDPGITTTKISSARKQGITIISEDNLKDMDTLIENNITTFDLIQKMAEEIMPIKSVPVKVTKKREREEEVVNEVVEDIDTNEPIAKQSSIKSSTKKPLSNMIIAMTGRLSKPKEEFAKIITSNGGTYANTVTKKITHLVAKDIDAASAKLEKARKNGAEIVDESFLLNLSVNSKKRKSLVDGTQNEDAAEEAVEGVEAVEGGVEGDVEHGVEGDGVEGDETGGNANLAVLLAKSYDPEGKIDIDGYWYSEKLDGVRAYWNGQIFLSRTGNQFFAPSWFTDNLPKDHHLDGELFMGRKKFRNTVSIVKSHEGGNRWRDINFMVFDIPSQGDLPFEKRMELLKRHCSDIPNVVVVEQKLFSKETQTIEDLLKEVEDLGGEGLMLRQPGSKYIPKRSNTLLKVKSFYDDEAKVVGYATKGKGRLAGMTGSLQVEGRKGEKFKVGSGLTDEIRQNPPPIGTIISYRYQEKNEKTGIPRFPSYIGVAIDKQFP